MSCMEKKHASGRVAQTVPMCANFVMSAAVVNKLGKQRTQL